MFITPGRLRLSESQYVATFFVVVLGESMLFLITNIQPSPVSWSYKLVSIIISEIMQQTLIHT